MECFGDIITSLLLLLHSLRAILFVIIGKKKILTPCGTPFTVHFATTFTVLGLRKRNLFIIFYYVHYVMVMSKKQNFISALRSRRQDHEKNVYIRFHEKCINCYYVHYAAIMTKKYIFSFQHYNIHYTMMIKFKKNTFSPIANCYYVHYVVIMSKIYFPYSYYVHYSVIMTKIYVFISALHVLHLDHDKKYTFFSLHSIGLNHEKIYI